MSSPNEIAEAILIVIKRILKWFAIGLGGLTALSAVAAGGWWGYNYLTLTLPKSKIMVSVAVDPKRCQPTFPVLVSVLNNSSKILTSVTFPLRAYVPGHSTNHASWDAKVSYDKILNPGETHSACWRPPLKKGAKPLGEQEELDALRKLKVLEARADVPRMMKAQRNAKAAGDTKAASKIAQAIREAQANPLELKKALAKARARVRLLSKPADLLKKPEILTYDWKAGSVNVTFAD